MNNLQMRLVGDLSLRETAAPVADIAAISDAMNDMVNMMNDQRGVGLAAPQVGILQRFLVMQDPDTHEVYKIINPKIISFSDKTCKMEEGCLSVVDSDGIPIFADVVRPDGVVMEWTDENGAAHSAKFIKTMARIVQHEYDHLDGKLFIDYLSPIKREQVMRKVKKRK
jgi:peptide deformylase